MSRARRCRRARLALALLAVGLAGCMFRDLDRNLRQFNRNGFLVGAVIAEDTAAPDGPPPIVAFAYRGEGAGAAIVDWFMLARPGPYFLVAPVGQYRLAAFEDRNRSLSYDAGEPAGVFEDGALVEARPGEVTRGLDIALRRDGFPLPVPIALPIGTEPGVDTLPSPRLGEVVSLDDARFSAASAEMGLWRPVDFLFDVGAGIYFVEPYDPQRIPVLFVHGALGQPNDFASLIAALDRRRFQPWVAFYPTAVRLEIAAAALDRWLQTLELRYGFERLVLVAHSMGGLVVRRYLDHDAPGLGNHAAPVLFVSISTPWQGHAGAAFGVDRAPVVAPSWYDVMPGSPFLVELLRKPLPPQASFDLYFSYGGGSRLRDAPNDGVVTLASQLDERAQDQARRVLGFDASHRGVLDSPRVAAELGRALAAFADGASR